MAETTLSKDAPQTAVPNPSPAGSKASKPNQRKKSLVIILIVFALLGGAGIFWWLFHKGIEDTDNATIIGHIHPISPRVGGTVEKVLIDDNQIVHTGQTVAILDSADYRIALSQAEHNLAVAKSQAQAAQQNIAFTQGQANAQITQMQGALKASHSTVGQNRQALREARAAIETARQNLAQQEATLKRFQADYQRYAGLDPEAVSGQQLDSARTAMQVAEAARNAAQASLMQAKARAEQSGASIQESASRVSQARGGVQGAQAQTLQIAVVRSQYQNALAQIKVAEDQVRQAKLNLSYTRIKAPAEGRIGRRTVEIGQRIQPGEPLMSVVSSKLWVVANFKETQLGDMKPGQPVDIEVDSFPKHHFKGYLDSFSPASGAEFALLPPENATGNFTKIVQRIPVKIVFDPKSIRGYETRLAPGMSVIAKVDTNIEPKERQPVESNHAEASPEQ